MPNLKQLWDKMKQPPEEEDDMSYEDFYSSGEEDNAETQEAPAEEQQPEQQGGDDNAQAGDDGGANMISVGDENKVHFVLFKPETFDKDVTKMADEFVKRNTVILNMEQTNKDVAKRIIDFLGGVAYAHSGKISRVAEDTYIVMPSHVELSGDDLMDEVESDNVYF